LPVPESFDFLYMPSNDAAADLAYYRDVLGAEIVFAIERFGTRVAQLKLAAGGPRLMVAEHLEGEAPFLVHRVDDLEAAIETVEARGGEIEEQFGIPHGPGAALRTPGGQRLALYELTRPETAASIEGRMDFEPKER
jgi:predicted enzyme related to lactoylglutathione lyase